MFRSWIMKSSMHYAMAAESGHDMDAAVNATQLDVRSPVSNSAADRPTDSIARHRQAEIAGDSSVYGAGVEFGVSFLRNRQGDTAVHCVERDRGRTLQLVEARFHGAVHGG